MNYPLRRLILEAHAKFKLLDYWRTEDRLRFFFFTNGQIITQIGTPSDAQEYRLTLQEYISLLPAIEYLKWATESFQTLRFIEDETEFNIRDTIEQLADGASRFLHEVPLFLLVRNLPQADAEEALAELTNDSTAYALIKQALQADNEQLGPNFIRYVREKWLEEKQTDRTDLEEMDLETEQNAEWLSYGEQQAIEECCIVCEKAMVIAQELLAPKSTA